MIYRLGMREIGSINFELYTMKKIYIQRFIFVIVFLAIMFFDPIYEIVIKKSNIYIDQFQSELNEKVISKTRVNNTCYFFKTDKENAFMIDQMTRNGIYETFSEYELFVLLNVNDSIFKKANNDTIYVYHRGKEYYYVVGKSINMPR